MRPEYEIFQLTSPGTISPGSNDSTGRDQSFDSGRFNDSYKKYELLLDPEAKKFLDEGYSRLTSYDGLIAIGVKHNLSPVGLAVASFNKILENGRLLLFFTVSNENHFDEELNLELMMKLLKALKINGVLSCDFIYLKEDIKTPFLEQILKKTEWNPSRLFMIRYVFNADTFNPGWLKKKYSYPEGFHEFPWKELSNEDREKIKKNAAQRHFRSTVSPFIDEKKLEPLNSLGVKNKDGVVAWILTHRIDENTLRYSAFFVDRSLRDKHLTIKLLANSILLQITKAPQRRAIVEIPVTIVHPHWIIFAKKRLEPYSVNMFHLLQARWIFKKNEGILKEA